MTPTKTQLYLTMTKADADAKRLDEFTQYLLRDLKDLGIESVERPSGGPALEGAK